MAFNERMIEEILDWCLENPGLDAEHQRAHHQFFAEDDPRPVKYWLGAEDHISKERRFLGYFMFGNRLSSGETPRSGRQMPVPGHPRRRKRWRLSAAAHTGKEPVR